MAIREMSSFTDIGGGVCRLWIDVSAQGRITGAGCDNDSVNAVWIQVISGDGIELAAVRVEPGEHPVWTVPGSPTWQGCQTMTRYPA